MESLRSSYYALPPSQELISNCIGFHTRRQERTPGSLSPGFRVKMPPGGSLIPLDIERRTNLAIRRLRRRWLSWGLFSVFAVGMLPFLLAGMWERASIQRYLILSYLGLSYQLVFLWSNLKLNHRPGERELLPGFGPGNIASMGRGLMLVMLTGFLFSTRPLKWGAWLPMILYTTGDVIDYFDGYLARRSDHVTLLGERMDMEWDAYGLLIATVLAIWYGKLTWIFLPIGLARYGFSFGLWFLKQRGRAASPLPPSISRRPIAGLTMGFMSAMLWPIVPFPASAIAGAIFLGPFAMSFLRDWLVVSGSIDPSSRQYERLRRQLKSLLLDFFPVLVRLALALALLPRVWVKINAYTVVVDQFAGFGYRYPFQVVLIFAAIELLTLVCIFFGVAGRFAAFLLIFPIGFTLTGTGQDLQGSVLLVTDLLVLILGTGRLSLWKPSEKVFAKRAGED